MYLRYFGEKPLNLKKKNENFNNTVKTLLQRGVQFGNACQYANETIVFDVWCDRSIYYTFTNTIELSLPLL